MKKSFFAILVILCAELILSGCSKSPAVTTLNPYLTATIGGTYNYTSATVVPALIDTQTSDTGSIIQITGNTADPAYPGQMILLYINHWNGATQINSIVEGNAAAVYVHNGTYDAALGGIVVVTKVTANSIIGYFSFNTASGLSITNGEFSVGRPWKY